jgi:7,8-dihydropterin-6-yl-methyl-4-(beta-D-ribofuranosyl)aminobenzene 5'-phosphate synthase
MSERLREVDRIEVLTLMDNYADVILGNTRVVRRANLSANGEISRDTLVGEHGLSLLVTVRESNRAHTILFDTGYSAIGVPHNMEYLGLNPEDIEAIVLSHGHMDHLGSLHPILEKTASRCRSWCTRRVASPRYLTRKDGEKDRFPVMLDRKEIEGREGRTGNGAPTLSAGI